MTIQKITILFWGLLISFGIKSQTIDTLVDVGGYKLHFNIIKGKGIPILFEAGANLDVNLKTKYTRAGERAKGLLDEAKPLKRGNRKSLKESAARILTAYGKAEIEMAKGTLPAKAFENHKGDLVKGINNIAINGGDKELELADEVSKSILPLIADPKSKLASALNQIQQQIEAERKKATTPQAA